MASHFDGTWTIVYAEKNGEKMPLDQNAKATISGNVLTVQKEGKEHRMQLQFSPNHQLMAWHQAADQSGKKEQQPGKPAAQAAPPATPEAKRGEAAQTPQTLNAQRQGNTQQPNNQLPGAQALQAYNNTPHAPIAPQQGLHHGVYIESSEFLCLSLDGPFMEEKREHVAAVTPKPGTTSNLNPPAATQPGQRAATPAPATPGVQQAKNERPGQAGETRSANYPADHQQAHPGTPQNGGMVLILHREGGQQRPAQGK
jgi:uncharacterized protein (TIGR03067 family)